MSKSTTETSSQFSSVQTTLKDHFTSISNNYNQLSEDNSLMESELANLQYNFKECNQSIETLTNRLQSNYEDLTRFINKGIKGGGVNNASSNASINNHELEEEIHRIKNDLKNVMNSLKDIKK